MRVLLSDRRRLLSFLSNAISAMGDDALFLALVVWVKELTGSTAYAAIDMGAISVASLVAPLTGVVVDRVRRKPLLLVVYAATALLLLTLMPVHRGTQVWLVIGVTFLYGLSGNLTGSGQSALLKNLVPEELLADANSLEQALYQAARLITPALGVGVLARFGAPAVLGADIATFVIAGLLLLAVRVHEPRGRPRRGSRDAGWFAETSAGFRFVAASPVLRPTVLAKAVGFLALGLLVPVAIQVVTVGLHYPPSFIAVSITFQSVFGVAGAAVAGRLARRLGDAGLMVLGLAVFAAACAVLAIPSTPAALGAIMLLGWSVPWFLIGSSTAIQKATPRTSSAASPARTHWP